MGQKVHPIGFRLGITKCHQSQWYASKQNYFHFFDEDFFLRKIILKNFNSTNISKIEIYRKNENNFHLIIHVLQAKIILGTHGQNLTIFQKYFIRALQNFRNKKKLQLNKTGRILNEIQLSLCICELEKPEVNALMVTNYIVDQLQKRIPFRRVIKKSIRLAQSANAKGIKIQISGRLNGAEIARTEWLRQGRIPLQTLSANIDYCCKETKTIYGILGIKVWIL
uniref:Small ribosomal subunit protein uS3c n=1 Tax=Avrainvillea sp. HV04061 TaxID=2364086 RepID=A0A3B8D8R3_9CHLO|nr:ribosomal protein S3 [Avrainvillea sp. HV04061]